MILLGNFYNVISNAMRNLKYFGVMKGSRSLTARQVPFDSRLRHVRDDREDEGSYIKQKAPESFILSGASCFILLNNLGHCFFL